MSEILATSPALDNEAMTVEGRLADIIETAEVVVDGYKLSKDDRAKVIIALRAAALCKGEPHRWIKGDRPGDYVAQRAAQAST